MKTIMKTVDWLDFSDSERKARIYTTQGRAYAAACKMIGNAMWWRVVELGAGRFVIDTYGGFVAGRNANARTT